MRAGPIAHGALLVAALGFAYQTWTRVETEPPKAGAITVWKEPVSSFQSFAYDGERKSLRIEKRGEGNDTYLWGTVTRSTKKRKKKVVVEGDQPTPSAPADPHGHGAGPTDAKQKLQELKDKAADKPAPDTKPAPKKPAEPKKPEALKTPVAPKPTPAKPAAGDADKAPQSPHRTETTDQAHDEAGDDHGHGADDGHGHGDGHGEDATDSAVDLPAEQYENTVREFPVGKAGKELVENLSHLRALRDLGKLSEAQKEEYGLADTSQNLTVFFEGGVEHNLIIGNRVVGGSDRYALATETGRGYVLSHGEIIKHIDGTETSLGLKVLHAFQQDAGEEAEPVMHAGAPQRKTDLYAAVGQVEIESANAERVLHRTKTTDPKGNDLVGWATPENPDTPDLSLANFINQIERLKPTSYGDEVSEDQLELVLSLTYKDTSGKELGSYKLYKKPVVSPEVSSPVTPALEKDDGNTNDKPDYYVVTELTRRPGKVSSMAAERVESDISQLLGGGTPADAPGKQPKQLTEPGKDAKGATSPTPSLPPGVAPKGTADQTEQE